MQGCFTKNFTFFFLGQLLTHLGDSFLQICTVAYMMAQIDKPGSVIAMILFFFLFPSLLFSPIAGFITDKFSRKKIMIYSTIYRLLVSILFLVYIFSLENREINEVVAYLYSFLVGIGMATFYPAKMATVPNVVPPINLKPANALVSGSGNLSITAGSIFAGLFIKYYGIDNCFHLGLLMYFIAILFLLTLSVAKDNKIKDNLKEINPIKFLATHSKTLYSIIMVVIITLIGATFYSSMNAVATDTFKVDVTGLTLLKGILGFGSCFGILFNFIFAKRVKTYKLMTIAFLGIAIALLTSSYCNNGLRAIIWLGSMGFFAIILQISIDIMLQKTTHDKVRGKIFGLKSVVTTTATLLATLFVSLAIKSISPLIIIQSLGIACIILAIYIFCSNKK